MVLLEIHPNRFAQFPFEGYAPGSVDVKSVALRFTLQGMKVKAWDPQVHKVRNIVLRIQTAMSAGRESRARDARPPRGVGGSYGVPAIFMAIPPHYPCKQFLPTYEGIAPKVLLSLRFGVISLGSARDGTSIALKTRIAIDAKLGAQIPGKEAGHEEESPNIDSSPRDALEPQFARRCAGRGCPRG